MSLYSLTNELMTFLSYCEDNEVEEDVLKDTLEGMKIEWENKLDEIACAIKNINAESDAIDKEVKMLQQRKKAKENLVTRLQEYVSLQMKIVGLDKYESSRNRISYRTSKAVAISDEEKFLAWAKENRPDLLKYEEPKISKTNIKEAIQAGEEIDFATIEERRSLQIK